ncbi:hypothetical protein GCM10009611_14790 [Arthrobacter roseus]
MQPALKIRYGRTALALVGAGAVCAAFGLAIASVFGAVSGFAPLIALAVAAGSVVILRSLAVRDRRARINAAFRDAMYSSPSQQEAPVPAQPEEPTQLFDAEDCLKSPDVQPLSSAELRLAALEVAAAAGDIVPASGTTWEPVAVPTPVYVQAPKAARPAPEPLRLPETPKAEGKATMKQAASEHRASAQSVADDPQPTTGRINLDDVLQRRRA